MEVDDFDATVQTIASSSGYDKSNPIYNLSPIFSLASLTGSTTAAEYSQMQGFKGTSIGKLKVHVAFKATNLTGNQHLHDECYVAWALLIAQAVNADGTPLSTVLNMNPFISTIHPQGQESYKNPWSAESVDPARIIVLKRSFFDMGSILNGLNRSAQWNLRTRRGYRMRDTDCLYFMGWSAPRFNNPTASDFRESWDIHIGVPRAFRR